MADMARFYFKIYSRYSRFYSSLVLILSKTIGGLFDASIGKVVYPPFLLWGALASLDSTSVLGFLKARDIFY